MRTKKRMSTTTTTTISKKSHVKSFLFDVFCISPLGFSLTFIFPFFTPPTRSGFFSNISAKSFPLLSLRSPVALYILYMYSSLANKIWNASIPLSLPYPFLCAPSPSSLKEKKKNRWRGKKSVEEKKFIVICVTRGRNANYAPRIRFSSRLKLFHPNIYSPASYPQTKLP